VLIFNQYSRRINLSLPNVASDYMAVTGTSIIKIIIFGSLLLSFGKGISAFQKADAAKQEYSCGPVRMLQYGTVSTKDSR
jgi:hypothetical protein